ncbi:hypothetical protein NDU88_007207 [Pleurodeles waltl]|uniref:Uncharacterized protein n=1 Tax=Pleurodeles waltl TaxID=8319 RepID=A0AAV7LZ66_PLEWA|nr:hypothetical protein NDU88_007207 [Pleurodeles waltl]
MPSPELTLDEVIKENLELFNLCLAEDLSGQYVVEAFSTLCYCGILRWFNADCSASDRALRRPRSASPRDTVLVVHQRKQYKEITRKCCYEFVSAQWEVLAQASMQGNIAMFWAAVADVKRVNGSTSAISCHVVASAWEEHFSIIYAAPSSSDSFSVDYDAAACFRTTVEEVENAIAQSVVGKARGPDGVPFDLFKCSTALLGSLTFQCF